MNRTNLGPIVTLRDKWRTSLAVQSLRLKLPMQEAWAQALVVGELRSHMTCGVAKNYK